MWWGMLILLGVLIVAFFAVRAYVQIKLMRIGRKLEQAAGESGGHERS